MKTQRLAVASLVGVLLASSAPIANAKRRRRSGGGRDGKGGSGHPQPYEVWAPPQPPPPPTPPQVIELKPPTAGESACLRLEGRRGAGVVGWKALTNPVSTHYQHTQSTTTRS
jgi:hypothetical protein